MFKKIKNYRALLVIVLVLFSVKASIGQNIETSSNDNLLLDESIRFGVLKNGITYYIKPLDNSQEQLKMFFLVKTGSFDEEAHETNFAHHIEHLAFRPSNNFPNGLNGNPELLSGIGMNSNELGGMTSGNFTRYYFNPPYNDSKAIATGIKWFRDIADGLDLSERSVNRERGVLLQEFLAGEATQDEENTEEILNSKIFPCIDSHQDFVEKNKSFPYKNLREYYFRWYRPERMAMGVVGKIKNIDSIERLIKITFGSLKAKEGFRENFECGENYLQSPKNFAVVRSNPESLKNIHGDSNLITLFYRDPFIWKNSKGLDGLKRNIMFGLLTKILNERFKEKEAAYNNTSKLFSSHFFIITNRIKEPISSLKIYINEKKNFEKEALQKSIGLIKQFGYFGSQQEEFEEAKTNLLEDIKNESPELPEYWTDEIVNHFAYGEGLPTGKKIMIRDWLLGLSKEEFNEFIKEIISPMPDDIGVIIPNDFNTILSSEAKTRKIIKDAYQKPVASYKKVQPLKQLLSDKEFHSLKVQTENLETIKGFGGIKKFKLKNGISFILRPSNNSDTKSILLHGFSPYGASCFPKEDYFSAMYAAQIVSNSGVGNFTKFDLTRYYQSLDSVHININPYIDYHEAGIKAEVSKEKFEDVLQLVYLYIAKPRKDPVAFDDWKNWLLEATSASLNTGNELFDELNVVTADFSRRPKASRSISSVNKIKLDKSHEIYESLFGDIENFTFIISGDYDETEILPLLQKYLGNLPSKKGKDCKSTKSIEILTKGPVLKTTNPPNLYETLNSFYGLRFVWPQEKQGDWKEEIKVKALGYLASNLIFGLRAKEELSLYYFGAGGEYNRQMNRNQVSFQFVCKPEELLFIKNRTLQIIEQIKSGDVSNEVFEIAMNELRALYSEDYLMTSAKTAERFYRNIRYNEATACPSEMENYVDQLKVNDLQKLAQKYFQEEFFYEVVMEN